MENGRNNKNSWPWMVLLTVIVGTFLGRLAQTIASLALPQIMSDFNITVSQAGWISTAYILANAIFVPIWGKLADTLGRKRIYILGIALFVVGSVLSGFAWNFSSMLFFRVIQAIASSADYPTAMSLISENFKDHRDRAQALGIWSSSFAAAVVFGPLLGGTLIDNFGWRSIFFINLPLGLVGIMMGLFFLHESTAEIKKQKFDWWGSITLGISLSALVLVLDKGLDWGWLSFKSLITYFITLFFLWIFIEIENKQEEPVVDLKFFKNKVFVTTLANNFIVFMGMMGATFIIPIFVQTFMGYNATQTGYLFIPMAVMMMISSPIGGSLTGKVQPRYVIFVSTLIAGIGFYFFSFIDPRSTAIDIIIPVMIMAFGMGLGMAQRTNVIAAAVPQNEVGIASSVLALVRNISGAFGIALFSTILNNTQNSKLIEIGQLSVFNGHSASEYTQFLSLITLKAQIASYKMVFLTASIFVIVGSFTALFIKIKKMEMGKETEVIIE